jgi:hypothetical protein
LIQIDLVQGVKVFNNNGSCWIGLCQGGRKYENILIRHTFIPWSCCKITRSRRLPHLRYLESIVKFPGQGPRLREATREDRIRGL